MVRIQLLDLNGLVIRDLYSEYLPAGQYRTSDRAPLWDGKRNDGVQVAAGIYLYRVIMQSRTIFGKLIYLH